MTIRVKTSESVFVCLVMLYTKYFYHGLTIHVFMNSGPLITCFNDGLFFANCLPIRETKSYFWSYFLAKSYFLAPNSYLLTELLMSYAPANQIFIVTLHPSLLGIWQSKHWCLMSCSPLYRYRSKP